MGVTWATGWAIQEKVSPLKPCAALRDALGAWSHPAAREAAILRISSAGGSGAVCAGDVIWRTVACIVARGVGLRLRGVAWRGRRG